VITAVTAGLLVGVSARERFPRAAPAVGIAVAGLLLAPVPTLLGAGVAALVGSRAMAARRRHAERRAAADLLALARLTALGLTAGMPFLGAVGFAAGEVGLTVRAEVVATLRRVAREGSPAFATARGRTRRLFLLAGRAAASGAPVLPVVQGYAAELHAEDRARRIAAVRRLPVRLLFPLALLILPGFVLLAVGPAVIAGLRRLGR